jgi:hypothetical protein
LIFALLLASGACGLVPSDSNNLNNPELGDQGESLLLDDLRNIANDPALTEDEKRDAFRALGIEDEDLIDALLTLEAS